MNIYTITPRPGPLVAAAIHNGHATRPELLEWFALSDAERRYEEDPYTAELAAVAPTQIVGLRSRFEVDLNRPRNGAVYQKPEDAWGLTVWNGDLPQADVDASLAGYDDFYGAARDLFDAKVRDEGGFVLYDLHSYNHRRDGADAPPADPDANPEINIGTGSVDPKWRPLIDRFIADLRAFDFDGRSLDVRENVKFKGGHFSRWTNGRYGDAACALAIEFKKTFMDEHTDAVDRAHLARLREALDATVPRVLEAWRTLRETSSV